MKLKRNEEIFREGRVMEKAKIERLVQEMERKKGKMVEKDVVIEGLRF